MAQIDQVNLRVPAEARTVISRVARRLREDRGFVHRLRRFLEEEENTEVAALMSEKIARIEGTLARVVQALPEETVDELQRLTRMAAPPPPVDLEEDDLPVFPWTSGKGRGKRLTPEGDEELKRLASEGAEDIEIAKRLGIKTYAVKTRRERLR